MAKKVNNLFKEVDSKSFTKFVIYCDGAICNNGKKNADKEVFGGTGWIVLRNGVKIAEGCTYYPNKKQPDEPTNNRMELSSFIEAYNFLNENNLIPEKNAKNSFCVYSDSAYFINSINDYLSNWTKNSWKNNTGNTIANYDLWREINDIKQNLRGFFQDKKISFIHVKGHADNELQNATDKLAVDCKLSKESFIHYDENGLED